MGLIGLRGKKDATFFYVPLKEKYSTPHWSEESTSQFANLRYGNDNRWQVMDTNFFFLIRPGGIGSVSLEVSASIARQSVIHLPAGSFKMFGYKIESSKDGASVKFSHGTVVATTDCTATKEKSTKP